ncbi:MAG TPA: hypothetical protein VNW92_21710 [Polyangiaceae bacterium]|jgi:hypothetical protein|nr:hypothetical protein [Polyangiaceae bacterium]
MEDMGATEILIAWLALVGTAQLNVSPTNLRALNYYRKHGWKDCGLRPGRDDVHLMEHVVTAAAPL